MGRILVIRGGAIGDFVLTLPVLGALRTSFPQTRLEVLGYPHIAKLSLLGGLVDAVHPIEARALAGFFASGGPLDHEMAGFFSEFALIVSYLYDPDAIFRTNIARCSAAQFIRGPHRPDEHTRLHAVDAFLRPLEALAIFDADSTPRLSAVPVRSGPGRWIGVHPGSGSDSKNWPERHWMELLRCVMAETDLNVLLVGGEAEADRLARLAGPLPSNRLDLARSLSLDLLAGRLRACVEFIGHDSGITHLAAAVGLPCVVLWGPTDSLVWRPRGDQVLVLEDDTGLPGLEPESVWEVLRGRLALLDRRAPASAAE